MEQDCIGDNNIGAKNIWARLDWSQLYWSWIILEWVIFELVILELDQSCKKFQPWIILTIDFGDTFYCKSSFDWCWYFSQKRAAERKSVLQDAYGQQGFLADFKECVSAFIQLLLSTHPIDSGTPVYSGLESCKSIIKVTQTDQSHSGFLLLLDLCYRWDGLMKLRRDLQWRKCLRIFHL